MEFALLEGVGIGVIVEGIAFLGGQAAALLQQWRQQNEAGKESGTPDARTEEHTVELPPEVFVESSAQLVPDWKKVAVLEEKLLEARDFFRDLEENGVNEKDLQNQDFLLKLEQSRRVLEAVYGHSFAFQKEQSRETSPPATEGQALIEWVYAGGTIAAKGDGSAIIRYAHAGEDIIVDATHSRGDSPGKV